MTLGEIIKDCGVIGTKGSLETVITYVTDDSRKVSPGVLFVAVKGHGVDGHSFIGKALVAGAAAVVYEEEDSSVASLLQNDKNQWDTFHTEIEKYCGALERMATNYENAEKQNTQTATSRNYG